MVTGSKASEVITEFERRRVGMIQAAYSLQPRAAQRVLKLGMVLGEDQAVETYFPSDKASSVTPQWIVHWSFDREIFDRIAYQISPEGEFLYVELPERLRDIEDDPSGALHIERPIALQVIQAFRVERDELSPQMHTLTPIAAPHKRSLVYTSSIGHGQWFAEYSTLQGRFTLLFRRKGIGREVIDLKDYQAELE
jgi:hypothetical protein